MSNKDVMEYTNDIRQLCKQVQDNSQKCRLAAVLGNINLVYNYCKESRKAVLQMDTIAEGIKNGEIRVPPKLEIEAKSGQATCRAHYRAMYDIWMEIQRSRKAE